MNGNSAHLRTVLTLFALALCPLWQAAANENSMKTNWYDRTITNEVEVRIPRNFFITEYHTNYFQHITTNTMPIFFTNHVTKVVTNRIGLDAFSTNVVTAYKTNWKGVFLTNEIAVRATQTNFVDTYKTNWKTLTLPKEIAVNAFRTNFVDQYQTNLKTLTFTNWETVLVMKTNWVTKSVTNVVELDLAPSRSSSPAKPAVLEQKPANTESASAQPVVPTAEGLVLEAVRTARPPQNNQFEVQVKVKWVTGSGSPFQVQNWRVEKLDGSVLLFGQDQDFKKQLSAGKYRIEAKIEGETDKAPKVARGILEVTAREAFIEPKLLGRN